MVTKEVFLKRRYNHITYFKLRWKGHQKQRRGAIKILAWCLKGPTQKLLRQSLNSLCKNGESLCMYDWVMDIMNYRVSLSSSWAELLLTGLRITFYYVQPSQGCITASLTTPYHNSLCLIRNAPQVLSLSWIIKSTSLNVFNYCFKIHLCLRVSLSQHRNICQSKENCWYFNSKRKSTRFKHRS